ncbi:hypothetical protein AGRA3207_004199 [Actinomadura graeca]|uniref:Uncharacterized protein n=1 Tax=Actinomadura graeca TaxID=2750812 RepID=A0ABX8QW85_9ACTN|nr:hypothetical protein [Actinomadura graeca]QXJ23084.1 hypothetical protein AGRA3207_004199 [Actinomadura graeca]
MDASSHKLAALLAERLAGVLPRPLTVRAEGHRLLITAGGSPQCGSAAAIIVEDPGDDLDARIETAATAVLSDVQDCVAHILTEPWPPAQPYGMLPPPGARATASTVRLWYGDEENPCVTLPPIDKTELR